MNKQNELKFDMDAQLAQIEAFTSQQLQAVEEMINSTREKLSVSDANEAVEKVGKEVTGLLSSLEERLEEEMSKINQQLEGLLPTNNQ
ncbi:hypothetical protein MSP8887_01438 [Marinomonas spartinae]|uniref:hypothetical protein n=1 Tax=Marinomonas spartinae TaxID=1792290 RepID=UPI000808E0F1|nr:hypothetical protein [Marinomonas spartinae]SBS31116.1 hypothetical protein MSP8887_01438 [Marinomonas spartinae]